MSERSVPDDELEQLASAVLDGVATAAEQARLDADPVGQARLAGMRHIRHLLATSPDPVDTVVREAHLATALAAWSSPRAVPSSVAVATAADQAVTPLEPGEPSADSAPVLDLADVRRRRHRWAPVLAAAAAIALLAGVGLAVSRTGDGSDVSTGAASAPVGSSAPKVGKVPASTPAPAPATAADEDAAVTSDAAGAAADPVADESSPGGDDVEIAAPEEMVAAADVAPFDAPVEVNSRQELTAAVDDALADEAALPDPQTAAPRSAGGCPAPSGELIMEAVWLGRDAYVYVQPSIADPQQVLVLDAASCGQLFSAPLVP